MPNIQVKNVPAEIHAILRDRAAGNHQSLQEFILETLIEVASTPTDSEIFEKHWARVDAMQADETVRGLERPPVTRQPILEAIDEGRARR
ncbi:MAG: hypothetical protein JWR83_753 [Aeromicrobium sp.]|nr:hypothetical protein [Aeromicrobium sp.]